MTTRGGWSEELHPRRPDGEFAHSGGGWVHQASAALAERPGGVAPLVEGDHALGAPRLSVARAIKLAVQNGALEGSEPMGRRFQRYVDVNHRARDLGQAHVGQQAKIGSTTSTIRSVRHGPGGVEVDNGLAARTLHPDDTAQISAFGTGPAKVGKVPAAQVVDATIDWVGHYYAETNGHLRGVDAPVAPGTPPPRLPLDKRIKALDAAMAESKLDTTIQVDRGLSQGQRVFGDAWNETDLTGLEWDERGYVPVTADPTVAQEFTNHGGAVMVTARVPKGVGAITLSDSGAQSEILLQRGLRWRVTADNGTHDGVRYLDVEVIGGWE